MRVVGRRDVEGMVLLALVYTLLGRLGLSINAVSGFATLVWAPTGVAIAALVCGGPRLVPGVFAGALAVNLWSGAPLVVALGIALGNSAEAWVAAMALRRLGFDPELGRVRDVAALAVIGSLLSTTLSATIGVTSLLVGGLVSPSAVSLTWRTWWIGDVIGALVGAPAVLALLSARGRRWNRPSLPRIIEAVALGAAVLAAGAIVFGDPRPESGGPFAQPFLLLVPLLWAAFRFGPRGAVICTLLTATMAVTATVLHQGPYARLPLHEGLGALQVFLGVSALGALLLGAAIAERHKAEEALARSYDLLSAVVDGTSDAVFAKDADGKYLMANRSAARSFGKQPDDLIGRTDAMLFPNDEAVRLRQNDAQVMATGQTRAFEDNVTLHGQLRTVLTIKSPLRDHQGRMVGVVGISRDITERKKAEVALRESLQARDELLSVASHELRTPLAALSLEMAGLRRVFDRAEASLDREALARRLERAARQADRLNGLLEGLLDVSRIRSGHLILQPEPLDAAELVRDVVDRFTAQAQRVGTRVFLTVEGDPSVRWDRTRTEQMLTNLVSNAVKYGAGHDVDIRVSGDEDEVMIAVSDRGIGIAPDDIARIFERFERAVPQGSFAGTGLGLYITRHIAEAHGGTIRVVSTPRVGSTFTVILPRSVGPSAERAVVARDVAAVGDEP